MYKRILKRALCAVSILLMVLLVVSACVQSNQALRAFPIPIYFEGEYSQNGSDYQPLTAQTRLSALDGDLILRGSFSHGAAGVACYLDHIRMTLTVNGEVVDDTFPKEGEFTGPPCGAVWYTSCAITDGDAVEIRLSNPHTAGVYGFSAQPVCSQPRDLYKLHPVSEPVPGAQSAGTNGRRALLAFSVQRRNLALGRRGGACVCAADAGRCAGGSAPTPWAKLGPADVGRLRAVCRGRDAAGYDGRYALV
ncbi:MAG: hypothetical protein PHY12_02175 [Eubacteriales bacterium]|nr:hypothetical protein [Eubacteriales bacterium]